VRRHLNTLYVTSEGAWLSKDGANVVASVDKAELGRVPIHMLGGIVCFGRVGMSPPLMGFCAEQGVCVSFLSENGRFLARVEGPVSGNVSYAANNIVGPTIPRLLLPLCAQS
jgi:CRISPR-associated protein Cas1